jgi:hypothetical protein
MKLKTELEFYESIKDELLIHHKGKFALIHGKQLIDTFNQDVDAYKEGVRRFGNTPFLVRLISDKQPEEKYPALMLGLINANT